MTSKFSLPLRLVSLLLIASGLSLSACASNSDRRGPPERGDRSERPIRNSGTFLQPAAAMFAGMDLNGDKIITRDEMLSGTKAEWQSFSGTPSATTFSAWSLKTLGSLDANPTFISFDRDFNQVISEGEFANQIERLFTQYDKNGDGAVERSEMIIAFQARQGRAQGGGQGQGRGQRQGRGRGQGGGGQGRPQR